MKNKICTVLLSLLIIVACSGVYATTMCVQSDTVSIILDPSINGTNYTYGNGEWSVTFDYGTVSGISTCNSTSGSYGTAYPQYDFGTDTTGVYCWCRMLRPARSAWVYAYESSSAAECASDCAANCGDSVRYRAAFRGGVFGSAGN